MKRKAKLLPQSALEPLASYEVQTPGGAHQKTEYEIFRAKDGRYFYRDFWRKELEPITELEAVKDWTRNMAPPQWVQLITRALTLPGSPVRRV